jgi:hypothetical protein
VRASELRSLAYRLTMYCAQWMHRHTAFRVHVLGSMAVMQSLGGGWAAVRNPRKARQCAIVLSQLARLVGDEATVSIQYPTTGQIARLTA